jgi:hypothetical protein
MVVLLAMLAVIFLSRLTATAQNTPPDVLQSNEKQTIDALGDATLAIELKLTAKQYVLWKQKYGNNPSILRRDMGRLISQYETSNFDVEQDDMDRVVRVTLDAKGVVTYKGDGRFEFKVPKEWTGGQRVGNEYRFNYIQSIGPNSLMQHNVVTVLPAGASDIQDQLSEEGEKVVQYTLTRPSQGVGWMIGAIAFGLLGIASLAFGFIGKPGAAPPPPSAA